MKLITKDFADKEPHILELGGNTMSIITRAWERLEEEIRQYNLGLDNMYDIKYWRGYIDGAEAQKKEDSNETR